MREESGRGTWLAEVGLEGARGRWNLSDAALYEEAVRRSEGVIAQGGPLADFPTFAADVAPDVRAAAPVAVDAF